MTSSKKGGSKQTESKNKEGILDKKVSRRQAVTTVVTAGAVAAGVAVGAAGGYVIGSSYPLNSGGSNSSTTTSTSAALGEPQEITIQVLNAATPYEPAVNAYMAQHPGVKINISPIPEANMNAAMLTVLPTAPPPDIIYNSTVPAINAEALPYALQLDKWALAYEWDKGTTAVFNGFKDNGHYYWWVGGWIYYGNIYVNTDLFKQLNIAIPTSYDTMVAAGKALKAANVGGIAMGFQQQPEWFLNTFSDWAMNALSTDDYNSFWTYYGPKLKSSEFDNRPIKWTDPKMMAIWNIVDDWGKNVYMTGITGMTDQAALQLFTQQKAAMYQIGSWAINTVETTVNGAFNWDFFPISSVSPQTGGNPVQANSVYGGPYLVAKNTKSPYLCADWLNWNLSSAIQLTQITQGSYPIIPLSSGVVSDPQIARGLDYAAKLGGNYSLAAAIATELHDPFEAQCGAILSGSATPQQAAQAMEQLSISIHQQGTAST